MAERRRVVAVAHEEVAELQEVGAVGLERVARQPPLELEVGEEVEHVMLEALRCRCCGGDGHVRVFAAAGRRTFAVQGGACAPARYAVTAAATATPTVASASRPACTQRAGARRHQHAAGDHGARRRAAAGPATAPRAAAGSRSVALPIPSRAIAHSATTASTNVRSRLAARPQAAVSRSRGGWRVAALRREPDRRRRHRAAALHRPDADAHRPARDARPNLVAGPARPRADAGDDARLPDRV